VLVIVGFLLLPARPASAVGNDLCDRTTAAVKAVAANGGITEVRRAVQLLKDVGKDAATQAQCGEALRASPSRAASGIALSLANTAPDYDTAAAVTAALVLDPTNPAAQALSVAAKAEPCAAAQLLINQGKDDQATSLVDDLVASGDDDAVACAKALKVQLANEASEPVTHLKRLIDYGKDRLLGPLVGTAVAVFLLLLALRLLRVVLPMTSRGYHLHRRLTPLLTRAAALLGAFAVAALVADVSEEVTDAKRWNVLDGNEAAAWWLAAVAVLLTLGATVARPPIRAVVTTVGLAAMVPVGFYVQYREAEWPRVLYLGTAAAAALLVGIWASGKVRITVGDLEGNDVPKGMAAAISAAYETLASRPPSSIYLAINAPEKAPDISFGSLPGSSVLTALLSAWRAITPSSDLKLTGSAITESDKAVRLSLSLSRGVRGYKSASIGSRVFWLDPTTADDNEEASKWSDLAIAMGAWLLLEVTELTGRGSEADLDGAKRWEGIALIHIANLRQAAGHHDAARELTHRACAMDPTNLAAQYSRLSLQGRALDGTAMSTDYTALAEALEQNAGLA
jgi:hypothetical protein